MSMTNEEKKSVVKKIFNELIEHYDLVDTDGLCRFLEVKYATLKGWERRGNIADVKPFLFKCQGINVSYLETGKGEMFKQASPAQTIVCDPQPCYTHPNPKIQAIVTMLEDMDDDTQKDIQLSVQKEKLLRDLLKQQEDKKAV